MKNRLAVILRLLALLGVAFILNASIHPLIIVPRQRIVQPIQTPSTAPAEQMPQSAFTIHLPVILSQPPVYLTGAGDIAICGLVGSTLTADLLDDLPGTIFTAGDNSNEDGTPGQYTNCFAPTWGRHLARIRPVPGNHDYKTTAAAGYFGYFGTQAGTPGQGWYSYDINGWHILALNSNCDFIGGCGPGSPQYEWLMSDLAAHPANCTLAYWHHPLFTSGEHGPETAVTPLWNVLYAVGAEVVVNGHEHHYERFAPQTPAGMLDETNGVREFIVGTGGAILRELPGGLADNSQFAAIGYHGVLRFALYPDSYSWQFISAPGGAVLDEGAEKCH